MQQNQPTPKNDFVTLTCPSCGGRLQITKDMDRFACGHCGNEHLVRREGGAVFLAPIAADIRHIRGGVDKTAAELAVVRLAKELDLLNSRYSQLSKRTNYEWLRPSTREQWAPALAFILPILMFIFLVSVAPSGASSEPSAAYGAVACVTLVLAIITFVGCFVMMYKLWRKRQRETEEMKISEMAPIHNLIMEKQELLARNRRIVDG